MQQTLWLYRVTKHHDSLDIMCQCACCHYLNHLVLPKNHPVPQTISEVKSVHRSFFRAGMREWYRFTIHIGGDMTKDDLLKKLNENRDAAIRKMKENAANNPNMDPALKEAILKLKEGQ